MIVVREATMVVTCLYKGLAKGSIDRLYLFCLPLSYIGVFLFLYFGTDLAVGLVCAITLLVGDAPGAILIGIAAGVISLTIKPDKYPGSTVQNSAGTGSASRH